MGICAMPLVRTLGRIVSGDVINNNDRIDTCAQPFALYIYGPHSQMYQGTSLH